MASEPKAVWGDIATAAFVQSCHLFKSLDEDALQDLIKLASVQTFATGEVIFHEGEIGEDFFIVKDGVVGVSVDRDGQVVDLAHFDKGACIGEGAVLSSSPRRATVSARTEVAVIRFPALMVKALGERFPKVLKLLETIRSARGKDLSEKTAE